MRSIFLVCTPSINVVWSWQSIKGETIPKSINIGFHWYDKTNIDAADIKPLLYE
ncbi:hypothetical protein [Paenibacillus sp. Soil787]|uniref:hypothetical protein n=1 Tax=Paenibacillus sp. Soil787 TaxID=1736411 RepID=UPI0012E3D3E1|nr:hypothetical protein [Paenibacillus sp. Soil787]